MSDPKFQLTYDAEKLLRERLSELKARMQAAAEQVSEQIVAEQTPAAKLHRLQGNVGALEWVLRQAGIEA